MKKIIEGSLSKQDIEAIIKEHLKLINRGSDFFLHKPESEDILFTEQILTLDDVQNKFSAPLYKQINYFFFIKEFPDRFLNRLLDAHPIEMRKICHNSFGKKKYQELVKVLEEVMIMDITKFRIGKNKKLQNPFVYNPHKN